MCSFAVSTVPADGLAPSGARPSAGAVLSKFGPVYIQDQHLNVPFMAHSPIQLLYMET